MTTTASRALVVDDNGDIASAAALLLELTGAKVKMACDGLSAIEAVKEEAPDVVFLNLGMPGMDGFEAARRIRALRTDKTPMLVAVTGSKSEEIRQRVREVGFDNYLVKPVSAQALRLNLAHAIARSPR